MGTSAGVLYDVDLASYAYQIWKNAIDRFPSVAKDNSRASVGSLFNSSLYEATPTKPHGVLVYLRTGAASMP